MLKTLKFAGTLLVGVLVLLLNWVFFTQGAEWLTMPSSMGNWLGGVAIGLAIVIDLSIVYYLIERFRK